MPTQARQGSLLLSWFLVLEQLLQSHGSHLMQSGSQSHLHRFHIDLTGLLALGEDAS
jgi:hypothetical protein